MSWSLAGRRCRSCPEGRPVWDGPSGLCQPCWALRRAFGRQQTLEVEGLVTELRTKLDQWGKEDA